MTDLVRTPTLDVAVERYGPLEGEPIVLLHGFPYDVRAFDEMVPALVASGRHVLVPFLRGHGSTRFRFSETPRSGQQAALAQDLMDLLDALGIGRAWLVGYDWGGRAACIVAALWPERVRGLVTGGGYNIQDIPGSVRPHAPETEHRLWYQYYLHTQRGEAGLAADRRAFTRLLWRLWSPTWEFDDSTFERTAASFNNPDFVRVVVQSYRHRFGYAQGDPALEDIEAALTQKPAITVPTVALWGADDGVASVLRPDVQAAHFTGRYEVRVLPGVGHKIPQEAPAAILEALWSLPDR